MQRSPSITCYYQLFSHIFLCAVMLPLFATGFVAAAFGNQLDQPSGPPPAFWAALVGVLVLSMVAVYFAIRRTPRRVEVGDQILLKFLFGSIAKPYTDVVEATVQFHDLRFGGPNAIPRVTDPTEFTLVFNNGRKFNLRVVPERRREFYNLLASKLAELNEPPVQSSNPFAVKTASP